MVTAINFAVRTSAGGRQHGTVAGEGQANFIQVGSGDSVSLNISPSSVVAYEQQGRDLVITLADGRVIVLAGYFDATGGAHLYLSSNDQITEVMLSGDGSGVLTAQYGPAQPMEKWSPLDDLRFTQADGVIDDSAIGDEPAGMGLFAPAMLGGMGGVGAAGAGLLGLGLAAGGGGGGGGGGDTTPGGGGDTTPGGGGDTTPGGGGDTTPGGGGDTTPGGGGDTTPGGGGDTTPGGGGDTTPGGGGDTTPGGGGDTTPGGGGDTTPGGGGDTTPGGGGDTTPGGGGDTTPGGGGDTTPGGGGDTTPGGGGDTTPGGGGDTTPGGGGDTTPGGGGDTTPGGGGDTTPGGGGDTTPGGGGDTTPGGGGDTTPGGGGDTTPGGGGDTTPGGGGDTTPGGGGDTRVPPTVNNPNDQDILTTNTANPVIEISGTGEPGDAVVVTVGNSTQTTVIGSDSTWAVDFEGDELPADGSYSSVVVVTEPGGTEHVLDGPDYIIDMTPPAVEVTTGTESVGDLENLADYADGITIAGEGEPGATVRIEVGGLTRDAVIDTQGNWSFTFSQSEIAGGERTLDVKVTATDPLGNTTVITDRLVIDTIPHPVSIDPVTENNLVNQAEYASGFSMTGSTSPNTTVTLVVEGGGQTVTRTITSDASGNWQQTFPQGTLPAGTYQATATLSTVDAAGNPSSVTRSFDVDTEISVAFDQNAIAGDNIVNAVEAAGAVTMSGTSAAGSTVVVEWAGSTRPATTDASGNWTVTFPAGTATGGTYETTAIVTATDAAGNTSSARRDILVDTEIAVGTDETQAGDNRISGAERAEGFTLTGTGEPGAALTVSVTTPGSTVTHPTTVGANGQWAIEYAPGELPSGTYTASVSVSARDAAGNIATDTHMVEVDTQTSVGIDPIQAGDNFISGAERLAGITLTGTAEANATLSVTFNGTTYENVRASADGTWALPVSTAGIPSGTTTANVAVTAVDSFGNIASASHVVNIDTEVVPLTRGTMSTGGDNILNDAEASRGLTVTGTVEAGSTVMVSFDGHDARAATVSGGIWSITIPASEIPQGTTSAELVVTATDRLGNTGVHREAIAIDREVTPLRPGQEMLSGDGYLNAREASEGLLVTGTSEPRSTVTVQMMVGDQVVGNAMRIVTDASGNWSTTFSSSNLPRGELNARVVVTAQDLAGNIDSYSQPLVIDTVAPGAPDVVKFERVSAGLTRIVTQEVDGSYEFTRIDANGNASHINAVRSIDEVTGDENITFGSRGANGFTPTPVPDGSYLVVDTTDLAGNQSSTLLIVNNTNAPDIDLSRPGLSNFDFSAIDLTFAPDADLTITEAQLLNITGADKTVLIKGGSDDRVEIIDGVNTGQTREVDGETYNIYTVGSSGATVLLDDDIQTV
ncbi:Ig-like domain-containing protein [Pseudotabrizicola algicola]|uniref:BapA prefix-like domain-containing protein n=1 Tax=Pseudotabrizicola algicola TaxID=2709381 RepID=A0A6B3RK64_9RHOB|nr:Ig-like domain-containing protein [Pseudotabrizicola algicola]NEX46457.1 BapA prefix-like domain-containing protein [Pseudotabrizicola algicola]